MGPEYAEKQKLGRAYSRCGETALRAEVLLTPNPKTVTRRGKHGDYTPAFLKVKVAS
jgi:hypothetical protein